MSYPKLLASLARTPRGGGDNFRTVLGTLMRQAFNDGRVPSKIKITADLRGVGWGGRRQDVARAYDFQMQALRLSTPRESQNYPLNSFVALPPRAWRKTVRMAQHAWVSYVVLTIVSRSS